MGVELDADLALVDGSIRKTIRVLQGARNASVNSFRHRSLLSEKGWGASVITERGAREKDARRRGPSPPIIMANVILDDQVWKGTETKAAVAFGRVVPNRGWRGKKDGTSPDHLVCTKN